VSFVGLARSDDVLVPSSGVTAEGLPIFVRPLGFNFTVVVEGEPGPSGRPVGLSTFDSDPNDSSVRSALEIIVSRQLGDGSIAVCDDTLPFLGGVPASVSFDEEQAISDAINDFACRFVDGAGNRLGRPRADACTRAPDGSFQTGNPGSTTQFCALIAGPFRFPDGDTTVSVRLRDVTGRPGPPQSFVVRISR
jgi:hypothetical protein